MIAQVITSTIAAALVTVAVSLTAASPAAAENAVKHQEIYYDIGGTSAAAWNREMKEAAADGRTGGKRYAYCAWNVKWRYTYSRREGACRVNSLAVDTTIKTTLPRLTTFKELPAETRQQWSAFHTALRTHEAGHARHGENATAEIEDLQSLTAPRCDTLDRMLSDRAKAVIEKYKAADKKYDATTEHGRTQGAWLSSR